MIILLFYIRLSRFNLLIFKIILWGQACGLTGESDQSAWPLLLNPSGGKDEVK